jgi:hypothetical protein
MQNSTRYFARRRLADLLPLHDAAGSQFYLITSFVYPEPLVELQNCS